MYAHRVVQGSMQQNSIITTIVMNKGGKFKMYFLFFDFSSQNDAREKLIGHEVESLDSRDETSLKGVLYTCNMTGNKQRLGSVFDDLDPGLSLLCQIDVKICGGIPDMCVLNFPYICPYSEPAVNCYYKYRSWEKKYREMYGKLKTGLDAFWHSYIPPIIFLQSFS